MSTILPPPSFQLPWTLREQSDNCHGCSMSREEHPAHTLRLFSLPSSYFPLCSAAFTIPLTTLVRFCWNNLGDIPYFTPIYIYMYLKSHLHINITECILTIVCKHIYKIKFPGVVFKCSGCSTMIILIVRVHTYLITLFPAHGTDQPMSKPWLLGK